MNAGTLMMIVVVGAIIGAVIFRCEIPFLKFMCQGGSNAATKGASQVAQNILGGFIPTTTRPNMKGAQAVRPVGTAIGKGTGQVGGNILAGFRDSNYASSLFTTQRLSI